MVSAGLYSSECYEAFFGRRQSTFKRQVSRNIPAEEPSWGDGALEISRVVALFERRRAVGARLEGCVASSNETSGVTGLMLVRRGDGCCIKTTARSLAYVNHREYWFQIE